MLSIFERGEFIDYLKYFIILQPILDILTFISIHYLSTSVTIGIAIRVLFLGFTLLYIFFGNNHPLKKQIITYIIVLFSVVGISFILNFLTKPVFYFFSEVQFIVKVLYFPIMFIALFMCFTPNQTIDRVKTKLYSAVAIAMTILSISMFISILTGTAKNTYRWIKSGYTGWFFAGNELSAIVGICLPICLIYAILKTKSAKDIMYWVPTLLLSITALLIGTKVSFFAMIMTLVIGLVVVFLTWVSNTKNDTGKKYVKVLTLNIVIIALISVITPFTPAYSNVVGDVQTINKTIEKVAEEEPEEVEEVEDEEDKIIKEKVAAREKPAFMDIKIINVILSSRGLYFTNIYNDYVDADIAHKLFGLGYAGFYEVKPKLIEMDFFDIFFSLGIIGSLLVFLPILLVAWIVLKSLFTNFRNFFQLENILLIISIGIGLGVAFLAGHVLFAPAVCIYLALSLVLIVYFNSNSSNKEI
ncbi:O-antigen ligase family protein [Pallidibacillus pasinlerensis]|uniref:O-antigen ligase like membrane protein n=1 Tax=Pallidibacillus pasinlerensis TaxID=2703818 RepID=A0ABX0A2M8_9BACI|nr:O-antigen ligase family protein [Pallidibacillus pasinlerensis]NCU17690.1 hypothetical protein [Pallidibacillus pasinlerensis]